MSSTAAATARDFVIGGDLTVRRLGYGTMQLTGPGVWDAPADWEGAIAVLRRAIELGVNLIDTADVYGPFVTDRAIREALYPYSDELVIATKVGFTRQGPNQWIPVGRPEYLRQQTELNLRHLGVERIDLLQLHRIDRSLPLAEQLGELGALQEEGKIRHIGLSEVTVEDIVEARKTVEVVTVQNRYNLGHREFEEVVDYCEDESIGFIPWFPLDTGRLSTSGGVLGGLAQRSGATPSQLALAWLLHRSPVMLPIPGTKSIAHLEENLDAEAITLSPADIEALGTAAVA